MALPRHPAAVDPQMPDVRGGLRRTIHRPRHHRLSRAVDSNSDGGVLFELAGVPCSQTVAKSLQHSAEILNGRNYGEVPKNEPVLQSISVLIVPAACPKYA